MVTETINLAVENTSTTQLHLPADFHSMKKT